MTEEHVFEAPWHAQLFAMTVHLSESGRFTWPDWTARFGQTLKAHGLSHELDGGDDYFGAWLDALENLLADRGLAEKSAVAELKAAWEAAYLTTPHGAPVKISVG
jgi:nitrile hydratase accessory protein